MTVMLCGYELSKLQTISSENEQIAIGNQSESISHEHN